VSERIGWGAYFLGIARSVSARADCTRRKVGAVIVDPDHRVISTGYNGTPPGGPSCLAGECPRGRHYRSGTVCEYDCTDWDCQHYHHELCACGSNWPCDNAAAPGSSYDTGPGSCISIHAEANALLWARGETKGATLYTTEEPCEGCRRLIGAARIWRVVTPRIEWLV
jgi:dCMP deaminase